LTPKKLSWFERLEKWRKEKKEFYAKSLMTEPEKTTISKGLRFPGCYLIMGARRVGKTGLAHEIARQFHEKLGVSAVLHMPYASKKVRRKIQAKLPSWMEITVCMSEWPMNCVVIYDEASQSAHARRSQSHDAITP